MIFCFTYETQSWYDAGMMHSDVFSLIGQDIRRLESGKADKHEIYSTNSRMDSLEHTSRETCSDVNGLRGELQTLQEEVRQLKERLEQLELNTKRAE